MCLRFAFLLITRVTTWPRLSQREEAWQTAEILILRHQLAVLQRRQPRRPHLTWADRTLLTALLSVIPTARRQGCGCWSPRTPSCAGTDIVRRRQAARSTRGRTGRPATRRHIKALVLRPARETPRMGLSQDPRRAGRPGSQRRGVDRLGDPQGQRHRPHAAADRGNPGLRLLQRRPARRHPAYVLAVIGMRRGASASSASRCTPPGNGPPSRPVT
jgi:hypothetical protein